MTITQRKALQDYARQQRKEFIAAQSDPYAARRDSAIAFLRSIGRYVLDSGSRPYIPSNGRVPQAMVELRERL